MSQKPRQKDDPVWTILPSYDMYQSTFNGTSDPPQYGDEISSSSSLAQGSTDLDTHPDYPVPQYSHSSCSNSEYSQSQYSQPLSLRSPTVSSGYPPSSDSRSHVSTEVASELTAATSIQDGWQSLSVARNHPVEDPSLIVADESTHTWRETILDNVVNLRNFSTSNNPLSKSIDVQLFFTEDVGERARVPKHIDPSQFEYKEGDFLNGYVLIRNNHTEPVPFHMFYVVFEGLLTITSRESAKETSKVKMKKFLEMYDFAASWEPSQVDRLLSENLPHYSCPMQIDPLDGSHLSITNRLLQPGVLYKRFFTFKIPKRLLDSECNDHCLLTHTQIPPTFGLSDKEKAANKNWRSHSNDFGFVGASTSYRVSAQFIGKASVFRVMEKFNLDTKLIDAQGDEFIIFQECASYVRLLQESAAFSTAERAMAWRTSKILYNNLVGRIQEKLNLGMRLRKAIAEGKTDLSDIIADDPSQYSVLDFHAHKARQLYTRAIESDEKHAIKSLESGEYVITVPLSKKKLIGSSRTEGSMQISTPRSEYLLNYLSPRRFCNDSAKKEYWWNLEVPLKFRYMPGNVMQQTKMPSIIKISSELVVVSFLSHKHAIPIEFNHDHLFQNTSTTLNNTVSADNFDTIVKRPMGKYAKELCDLFNEFGKHNFRVEKSLLEDVTALSNVEVKYNRLILRNSKVIEKDGKQLDAENLRPITLNKAKEGYTKELSVVLDATQAQKLTPNLGTLAPDYSSIDEFCLVPSFQHCNIGRMYYLRLVIHFSTSDIVEVKVPLTLAKIPST